MKYGFFDESKKEYVITRPDTPAPWVNYLGSPEYGAIISNNAGGYSFAKSGANGRILRYIFNQFDQPGRYIYLRDQESEDYWSASWQPVGKDLNSYKSECHHGTAYTKMMADYSQIHSEVRYYVPLNQSYEVWNLAVTNTSDRMRKINVTGYAEFTNNSNYEQDQVNLQYSQFITRTVFRGNRVRQMIHANLDQLEDGKDVSYIGNVGRQGLFYTAPDGNGMYFLYGYQGYQEITRITKSGKDIVQTLIESRELNANENYTEFADKIALLAPGDIPTHGNSYDVEVTAPDGGVNMRCGAGVEYDKVLPDMIPNGTVLTVTQEAVASNGNSWGYTNYNGTYGWIALTQVTKYEEPTEGAPIPHTRYVINCNESITLRTNPDVNAAEICQIPLGTAVATFGDAGNGFISVYYQGSSGYCLASYLSAPVD